MGDALPGIHIDSHYVELDQVSRSSITPSTTERVCTAMAIRKKRSRRNKSAPTEIATYTITVAHEKGSECDSCAQPRPLLIEQEGGAWMCEICLGLYSYDDFWRMALINGVYSWGDVEL